MPIIALGILVLLGIAGLGIDLNLGLGASTDEKNRADIAASAALNAFFAINDSSLNVAELRRAKLDAALARTREILSQSENFTMKRVSTEADAFGSGARICLLNESERDCPDSSGATLDGWLIAGEWFSAEPAGGCGAYAGGGSCPCNSGVWSGPCLRQTANPADPNSRVNAFQVELSTRANTLRTLFARLLGSQYLRPFAAGTAAVAPRRIIALIDFSSSVTEETHPSGVSSSTYRLVAGDCSVVPATITDPSLFVSSQYPENFGEQFVSMPTNRNGAVTLPTVHFKDDYQCFMVNDPLRGSSPYLVDTYRGPNYEGPQPQTRILKGLKTTLDLFSERGVSGDMVGLYAFDRDILGPRRMELTKPDPTNPAFNNILSAVDLSNVQNQVDKNFLVLIDPALAPNAYDFGANGIFTNLLWAVRQGREALTSQPDWESAENSILVFSDMLGNCQIWWAADEVGLNSFSAESLRCRNTVEVWNDAKNWLGDYVNMHLVPNDIALHLVASGPPSLGYHIQVSGDNAADGECSCITEEQRRTMGKAYGDHYTTKWFRNDHLDAIPDPPLFHHFPTPAPGQERWYETQLTSADSNYVDLPQVGWGSTAEILGILYDGFDDTVWYGPQAYYHQFAIPSGGEWAPILPPCQAGIDMTPAFERACSDRLLSTYTDSDNNGCLDADAGYFYRYYNSQEQLITELDGYIDEARRVRCDIKGRTADQQVLDYMTRIMEKSPYRLVAPSRRIGP